LLAGVVATLGFVVIEIAVALWTHSLALLSEGGHMLADAGGMLLALAAATAARRPADSKRTYGYARFEVLAVPVHVTLLAAMAAYIAWEAIDRLRAPQSIHAAPVIVVGLGGLAVNLLVVRLLHHHAEHNMNARAASLEAMSDALGSIGVVASATFIALGGWRGADALVGLAIVAFIVPRAVFLLRQAASILLEGAPPGLDPAEIIAASNAVEGVLALHDVHVWSIAPSFPALSAHVELNDVACTEHVLTDLAALMQERFGIGHVTLQPETPRLHEQMNCCLSPDAARMSDHTHVGGPT
jgi:cobalt-zinc-cadmium efflux system protein